MLRCTAKAKLDYMVHCVENTISARMQESTLEKAMQAYQKLSGE